MENQSNKLPEKSKIVHVEIDKAACFSLKTRTAYHYLKSINKYEIYKQYLAGKINRETLYSHVPTQLLNSVINLPIGEENNNLMFNFKDRGDRDLCLAPEYTAIIQQLAKTTFKFKKDIKLLFFLYICPIKSDLQNQR